MIIPLCILLLFAVPQITIASAATTTTTPCQKIHDYLSKLSEPQSWDGSACHRTEWPISLIYQQLIAQYKKDLELFAQNIQPPPKDKPITTVIYPLSGFDISPILLFPQAHTFILIDHGAPFLPRNITSEIHYQKELDIVEKSGVHSAHRDMFLHFKNMDQTNGLSSLVFSHILQFLERGLGHVHGWNSHDQRRGMLPSFLGRMAVYFPHMRIHRVKAFSTSHVIPPHISNKCTRYQCHGSVTFDLGEGTFPKEVIYIHGHLQPFIILGRQTRFLEIAVSRFLALPQIIFLGYQTSSDRAKPVFFPISLLSETNALVVRGGSNILQHAAFPHNVAGMSEVISPFLAILHHNQGVLVEGKGPQSTWEVIPDEKPMIHGRLHPQIIENPNIHFAHGDGIRALYFKQE